MNISKAVLDLAREAIETYCREGAVIEPPGELPAGLKEERSGVFVTLKKAGRLRGCTGTFKPTRDCLAREIIYNAIGSAFRDPRFPPVGPEELDSLVYTVSLLSVPEKIDSPDQLDPARYGVIVESAGRRGLLLPDLEGVDTVEEQLSITRQKAGIGPTEAVNLQRFEVEKYSEENSGA